MATEVLTISPDLYSYQTYSTKDTSLLTEIDKNSSFTTSSYIEYFAYTINKDILDSSYNFTNYTVLDNGQSAGSNDSVHDIIIDSETLLTTNGYSQGKYVTYFNFLDKEIGSNLQQLFISEISSDRTEIRLDSTALNDLDIVEQASRFIQKRENSIGFLDFYLNFGENVLVIANNFNLDNTDPVNPTILVKLYEPLPASYNLNSTLWIVTEIRTPSAYQVTFEDVPIVITDTVPVKGPNFNLDVKDQINNSTLNLSYEDLVTTALTSSYLQLSSLLEEKEIDINIDYTNFENFIHFSSVQTRIENFSYKATLLETYSASISTLSSQIAGPTSASSEVSNSLAYYENQINNIITNFDGYDYYLYYSSGSWAWPKTTSQPPYQLATVNSVQALTWLGSTDPNNLYYGGILLSASIFDEQNTNSLYYAIPEYLRNDPSNDSYSLFVDMIAQHYDNIWIYYKDVTEKYNADNRLENGISKDIVADAIRDFGIKLYQNNFSNDDLYTAFIGLTPEGSLFPFPNITGSLPTPSGFEYIDTLISASNDYIPLDDVNKSLYKRIYHNLPYLLKSKGTLPGLRALITSYGIPDTVLRINEYGGKDKSNTNDWDYWQNTFNYAFYTTGSNFMSTTWAPLNPTWDTADNCPDSVLLRFKTEGLPFNSASVAYQSLWNKDGNTSHLVLRYEGTGYNTHPQTPNNPSGLPYSGSTIDPYYQYAYLDFYPSYNNDPTISASVYLPFFDGGWWSVAVNRDGTNFTLSSGNKIYEGGENGTELGFYSTSSVVADDVEWVGYGTSYFARGGVTIDGNLYEYFSGSLQEIRYYTTALSESVFKDYIMNPHSIEGNSLNSSPNEVIFRASLGGELYTGSVSIHPKVTGSWATTSSFVSDSDFSFLFDPTYKPNTEYFFYDQVAAGIRNAVSDKIRVENNIMPSGDTLSPFRSLAQNIAISQSYTANTNLLEVAFSPQDEINEDIMDQIGYFNIGNLIGDPRQRSSSATSYPDLDALRNAYFEKYTSNYDLNDYIRLIKFFDNSLFKMIKDFVPARTSLASGVVIKQHLLERNKYPQPQVNINSTIAYTTSGSANNVPFTFQNIVVSGTVAPQWNDYNPGTIENFSGGTGGSFEIFNGINTSPYGPNGTGPENIFFITQSWIETIQTTSGSVTILHNAQDEFYDGEFSGSILTVTTQSLAQAYPLDNILLPYQQVLYFPTLSGSTIPLDEIDESIFFNNFLNPATSPQNGEMLIFIDYNQVFFPVAGSEYAATYFKIAKIDSLGNDNSVPLGQLDNIFIYKSSTSQYVGYDLDILNEYPNYYLYKIIPTTYGGFPFVPADNKILNYQVSASIVNSFTFTNSSPSFFPTESIDISNLYNSSSGLITFNNTPNTPIIVTASITLSTTNSPQLGTFSLRQGNDPSTPGNSTGISQNITITGAPTTFTISGSLYPVNGDSYYLKYSYGTGGSPFTNTVGNLQLRITQSRNPNNPSSVNNIFEPYLIIPNFYNSDYNPLINNIEDARLSNRFEEVEYYPGITTPINLGVIISGSAIKAAVQDSNYSSKRVINPRYNGVKSTSQLLNTWSPPNTIIGYQDEGTYGKIPTIESLKTAVAYCDWIGGWPPDRENASAIHVLYLIKADGSVIIPNTSQNSLFDIKGTFESGERLLISSKTVASGQPQQFRNIIRGGSRIEPILYNQSGSIPGGSFVNSIELTDNNAVGNVVSNFQAKLRATSWTGNELTVGQYSSVRFNTILATGSSATLSLFSPPPFLVSTYRYQATTAMINEGISLQLVANLKITDTDLGTHPTGTTAYVMFAITRNRGGAITNLYSLPQSHMISMDSQPVNFSVSVPSNDIVDGDLFYVRGYANLNSVYVEGTSTFTVNQFPVANSTIPTNNLWVSSSGTTTSLIKTATSGTFGDNIIYTTSSALLTFYGNSNVYQKNIANSGFNTITLPWSIEYGDEFRFEGREDRVYQIKQAAVVNDPLLTSPLLAVEINQPAPISGSVNINQFLIRRYVDEASQIIMEGFKPINSSGPYIVRPEYIVPELDKSVDEFILDLTQKGLIP